jgi:hypothetical protein
LASFFLEERRTLMMFDIPNNSLETLVDTNLPSLLPENESKAAARTAIQALRVHGDGGVERNLNAAAAVAALKKSLPHGEFGVFCERELSISNSYRARLIKLDGLREYVSKAKAWAATGKHRLAERQSAQNLIQLVTDYLKKDEPPKIKIASKSRGARPSQDDSAESEAAIREGAHDPAEHDKTLAELKSKLAKRDDAISELQRRLAEYEQDFVALRDLLPDDVREKALVALASSRDREFAAIAKRFHWRESDLRRQLESCTAV